MGYADDLGAFTYGSSSSSVGAGFPSVYLSKKFLPLLIQALVLHQFAQLRPLPEGNGKVAEFSRPRYLAPAMTALSEGQNPNATKVYWQKVNATLAEYGDFGQISSMLRQGHIDQELLDTVAMFSAQGAETMNRLLLYEICSNGCFPITADLSATSEFEGTLTTVTSVTSMASTGLAANTNYGDENDDCNQSIMVMQNGPAEGEARTVTDYVTSGGVITLTNGFDMLPEVGDRFRVCTPDEITTGDGLDYASVKKARAILVKNLAMKYKGGYFVGVVGPDQANLLMDDTYWKDVQLYTTGSGKVSGALNGEIGKLGGIRFVEHTTPFNFPVEARGTAGTAGGPGNNGANFDATAAVSIVPIFGMNSFATTSFKKKGKKGMKPPVRVKYANQYDKFDMLDRWTGVGWVIEVAKKSLFAKHCVGIFSEAA